MDRTEGSFSGAGGVEIAWRAWTGEEPARAVVVIAHDVCEHGGRYGSVVDWIVPKGYPVVAPDHPGHGRSGGERALIDDVDAAVADLGTVIDQARADHAGAPVLLLGQGMGGALGIALALRRPLDGLILSAPMLAPPRTSPVDATALSRDPAVVRAFETDPLAHHGPLPDRTVSALSDEIATFDSRAKELTVPFLLMHGYSDRLADPEASRAFHRAAGSDDKILVLWEGLFHEIFNEPAEDRELPLERLSEWLDAHAGT
ncbi:MAG: lysophospholipase [Solirubrobacteraceae bacterium]